MLFIDKPDETGCELMGVGVAACWLLVLFAMRLPCLSVSCIRMPRNLPVGLMDALLLLMSFCGWLRTRNWGSGLCDIKTSSNFFPGWKFSGSFICSNLPSTRTRELPLNKWASMIDEYFWPSMKSAGWVCESRIAVTGDTGATGFICGDGEVMSVLIEVGITVSTLQAILSFCYILRQQYIFEDCLSIINRLIGLLQIYCTIIGFK